MLLPLEPLELNVPVDRMAWALHLTVLPNFRSRSPQTLLDDVVRAVAQRTSPLRLDVEAAAGFGPEGSIPVRLVSSTAAHALHEALQSALASRADCELETPEFHGRGYRPHITDWHGALHTGQVLDADRIVLAEVTPEAGIPRTTHALMEYSTFSAGAAQ